METTLRVEEYRDKQGQHRWRMIAPNGRIIAVSSEAYRRVEDMRHALQLVLAAETSGWQIADLTAGAVV